MEEVAREHGWHPPKSLDSDENFKPEHALFFIAIFAPDERLPSSATLMIMLTVMKILSPNIRYFVAIYALSGSFWSIKVFFWSKTVFFG